MESKFLENVEYDYTHPKGMHVGLNFLSHREDKFGSFLLASVRKVIEDRIIVLKKVHKQMLDNSDVESSVIVAMQISELESILKSLE